MKSTKLRTRWPTNGRIVTEDGGSRLILECATYGTTLKLDQDEEEDLRLLLNARALAAVDATKVPR